MESATASLQSEWGDKFEAKVQAAQKVVDQFGASDIMELQLADGTKLGNNPDVIKAFSNIADFRQNVTSEDTISEMSQSGGMTAVSAQAEVDAIMNDKTHAYWDRRNVVGRQNAIKKVQELMGMIHGHT
jgi:hypothetical protein